MNPRSSLSQSPARKCYTPSLAYAEKPVKQLTKVQAIKTRYGVPGAAIRNFTQNSMLGQIKKPATIKSRVLKTEVYNDAARQVQSRNESVRPRKSSNSRQSTQPNKQTRSNSQNVDKENLQAYYAEKKRYLGMSLNSSFSRNLSVQQSVTPHLASKKGSLLTWATQQSSTRKSSVQNRFTDTFVALDNNQFAYQCELNSSTNTQIARNIQRCYQLIEDRHYDDALRNLKEIDTDQLSHSQVKDVAYLRGLILMTYKEYDQAIAQFNRILHRNERGDLLGQVTLLAAVAYKKMQNNKEAISILSQFISKKSGQDLAVYYDALIYRGKIYMKLKDFNAASADFQAAIALPSEEKAHQGKLGKADALRLSGRKQEALLVYNSIIAEPESRRQGIQQVYLRKVMTLFEMGKTLQALECIDELLEMDGSNSDALYLKGVIQQKQGRQSEALLSFEQAIKQNNSRKGVTRSLLEIARTKIDQRDFYAAYYTLQRAEHLDVDEEIISKMLSFTEGVVFLMKRKYNEGVANLTILINNHQLGEFLRSLVFIYRAYGYICLSKYQKALNDLTYVCNIHQLESGAHYNKIICEGIIQSQQNLFEKAISTFSKAAVLFPGRMEPYFYKSMTLMKFVFKHLKKDELKSDKYIKNALQQLDQAVTLNDQNSNLLYHRGLLRFYFMRIDEALQDFNKAIERSEENVSKYFYARGLSSACIKNEKQALSDFTIVINLDGKNADAYLNRAKVFQMIGDRNSAFNDLQKYISLKPHDPDIHLWAGNLLFNIGAYDNAIKAYSHSNDIGSNTVLLTLRAHCYIILKELNSALSDLSKIIELTGDKAVYIDKEALQSLKTASMGVDESALQNPQKLRSKNGKDILSCYRLASQTMKRLICINSDGFVFKISDLYFYRGVNKFYMKSYEKAIENWTLAYTIKQELTQKLKTQTKQSDDEFCKIIEDTISKGSAQDSIANELEDPEFEDRTFNMYEYYYDVSLAYVMQQEKYAKALEILATLKQSVSDVDHQQSIHNFMAVIQGEIQQKAPTKSPLTCLSIFPSHNRLCCIFPAVQLPFQSANMEARLSFCLPRIIPPSMHPEFDSKLIDQLSPEIVENKPEAPWIKRNQDGVVFTDNMQYVQDLDLKSESQQSENEKTNRDKGKQMTLPDDDDQELSINEDGINLNTSNIRDQSSGEVMNKQQKIEKLRQQLQLDVKVQARLAHLKQ